MAEQGNGDGKKGEGNQEFDNFQRLLKQVVSVPKEKVNERLVERKRERKERRAR